MNKILDYLVDYGLAILTITLIFFAVLLVGLCLMICLAALL